MVGNSILISFTISIILFWIYETDVIGYYLKILDNKLLNDNNIKLFPFLLKLKALLLIKAWSKTNQNYLSYVNSTYNIFITNLLSCPICLGFWICLIYSLFAGLQTFGIISYLSLFLYFVMKILIKVMNKL